MTEEASPLRPIMPLPMPDITPAPLDDRRPELRWVAPSSLFIEERYQRGLGERSIRLIRKIVSEFAWGAFKPPSCAEVVGLGLVVIDGQHTAIAAASHPDVDLIPVLVVSSVSIEGRAAAFLAHNRNRLGITPMQLHHSSVAAGDEIAVAIEQAASRSGARVLRNPPPLGNFKVGDTIALVAIKRLVSGPGGVNFAVRVLKVLVEAKRAPLKATEIKAVALLLADPEFKALVDPERLALVIRAKTPDEWQMHAELTIAKGRRMPSHQALMHALVAALKLRRT